MQDAFVGGWTSPLSLEVQGSLRELNHRFLDLAGACARDRFGHAGGAAEFGEQLAALSPAQRAAAADCPYALFDLRFQDQGHWQVRLQNTASWRVADDPARDADAAAFVQLALFYAWHVATTARLSAQLILGMHEPTATAFGRMTVDRLPALAATETVHLRPRWSHCDRYWTALVGAASRPDPAGLRRVQLFGIQLAAAARLPWPEA